MKPFKEPRSAGAASALIEVIDRLGVRMAFARNAEIYGQDDEVAQLYRVARGVVRTTRLGADGRRQIGDFYYPGDVFGLETGPLHRFSAEALTDAEVRVARRTPARALAGEAGFDRAILQATHRELDRAQNRMLLLGLKNAREKVAAFLAGLAQACHDETIDLPMSRQDMADYLGLTIETVSRMLTQLQDEALVEFPSIRRFRVARLGALDALAA